MSCSSVSFNCLSIIVFLRNHAELLPDDPYRTANTVSELTTFFPTHKMNGKPETRNVLLTVDESPASQYVFNWALKNFYRVRPAAAESREASTQEDRDSLCCTNRMAACVMHKDCIQLRVPAAR